MQLYRTPILCLALVMAPVQAARAQDFSPDFFSWSTIIPSVAQTDILGTHLRELRREDEERAAASPSMPRARTIPANPTLLRYAPSTDRRKANIASFLAKAKARDPAGARSLEELFAQGDIIARTAPLIGRYGLHIDNVADAYTVWWISAWQASHARGDIIHQATYQAVRAQAASALSATPELAEADDRAKQQLAEALLIQAALLDGAAEQAKGDPAKMRLLSKAAAQGGHGMGLDLMAMNLTPSGFVEAD